jgi:hypothetical protein
MKIDQDKEELASELRGSLLYFNQFFYKHLTGRDFIISSPLGRESHHITICRALTDLFRNQHPAYGLNINVPPGYGKSVMLSMFVAWCYAHYPDCNFLYISYTHELAASHTSFIKQIMSSSLYKYLFGVHLSSDTRAKDHFMTTNGGVCAAFGSSGPITGRNAGAPGLDRFSGCPIIDDAHKPNEIHSSGIREGVIRNYTETILQRPRDVNVPIINVGQRLHEDDLTAYLLSGKDVRSWESVILKGIDEAGNCLYPEVQSLSYLRNLQEKQPFVFSSQIQQEPIPSGGSLFKPEWFVLLDEEPKMLVTFITADTAETNKSYNDATVFSFFGVYEIEEFGQKTGDYGLHWLDCVEIRIEPKDLEFEFMTFLQECLRHPVKPKIAAIEKKSTGSTLISVLKEKVRTVTIREIERNRASGSKTQRFLECQPYVAGRKISLSSQARHLKLCIDHMSKITANDTHRWDDLADTLADGIKFALIDKTIIQTTKSASDYSELAKTLTFDHNHTQRLKKAAYSS